MHVLIGLYINDKYICSKIILKITEFIGYWHNDTDFIDKRLLKYYSKNLLIG